MELLKTMQNLGYGEIYVRHHKPSKLSAIIGIHSTQLGPALGGCRLAPYPDEAAAIDDVVRLAQSMSYKAALAGLQHGGGKAVIVRPDGEFDRTALFRAFGDMVEQLGGRYVTAEDSGTTPTDMQIIRSVTSYVTGASIGHGGSGDPSPFTALGVRRGIQACVEFLFERETLQGLHVCVQGVGSVGYHLCKELHALGAVLTVADTHPDRTARAATEFGARVVSVAEITQTPCDVFAPCAFGGIVNDASIDTLKCRIIAGGANNVLVESRHGDALTAKGIVYAPDYAINAGGLINVAQELKGYDANIATQRTLKIHDTIWRILKESRDTGVPPHRVADGMAERMLQGNP